MKPPSDRQCSRRGCVEPAELKWSHSYFCVRHYRFNKMRSGASDRRVYAPTFQELEAMVPDDMTCPACRRVMNWRRRDGSSTVITLQHDRSGEMRMMCSRCNSQHAHHPEDQFYLVPAGHKRCPGCGAIKHYETHFHKSGTGQTGHVTVYCKSCKSARHLRSRNETAAA